MTTQKQTQKSILAVLRDFAADLGALVSIRKNVYGEYDTRIRMNGKRDYVLTYLADSFDDAVGTARFELNRILKAQQVEGERRAREYDAQLQTALDQAQSILALVGCRIEIDPLGMVIMTSPRTGTHGLNMTLGVRPVSDLLTHAIGFAENQRTVTTFGLW